MRVDNTTLQEVFPFIEVEKTTKDEVFLKLGEPSGQFEDGRILTYAMNFSEKEGFRVDYKREVITHNRWGQRLKLSVSEAEYNLILVFDDKKILSRYNLLKISP